MKAGLRKMSPCQYVMANDAITCFNGGNLPPAVLDYVQGGEIASNLKKLLPKQGEELEDFEQLWKLAKSKIDGDEVEIPPGNTIILFHSLPHQKYVLNLFRLQFHFIQFV